MYRPPRDVNKNYQMFIQEIEPMLEELEKSNTESIITGDLNKNSLKINDKPIFNELFDTVISQFLPQDYITYKINHTKRHITRQLLLQTFHRHSRYENKHSRKRNIRPFPLLCL